MSDVIQDRLYQVISRDRCFERWQGGDASTLLILPTGTGKTVVGGMIARQGLARFGRRTLFIAHREELITQGVDKISRFGLSTAIEMGELRADKTAGLFGKPDVVVASIQSMQGGRLRGWDPREFGIIIIDECHHVRAKSYGNLLAHFRDYWLLGITATPDRGDGQNLGAVFDTLAYEYPLRDAILDGYLVPIVAARLVTKVNLEDIRTTGGDFNDDDLARRIAPYIEELASAFAQECGSRPSVMFCPDVRSSEAMADVLTRLGVSAEAVSGKMKKSDRREALRRFAAGEFQAIVCCDLLTEGWDEPGVSCVGICRPTKLRSRYAQMIGRGTRPHPGSGKCDCLVIDFAWETTAQHQLCTPADLFDDSSVADEVMKRAREIMATATRLKDPQEVIDEAGEQIREEIAARERDRLRLQLTGKPAVYDKFVYDPVGVGVILGVTLKQGWDLNPKIPPTAAQLDWLKKKGMPITRNLSKQGATKLISALITRLDSGMSSLKQIGWLADLGVDPAIAVAMTRLEASAALEHLTSKEPVPSP